MMQDPNIMKMGKIFGLWSLESNFCLAQSMMSNPAMMNMMSNPAIKNMMANGGGIERCFPL